MYNYSKIKLFLKIWTTLVPLMLLISFCSNGRTMSPQDANRQIGGDCVYTSYDGFANIIQVEKTARSEQQAATPGGPGYEGYEVTFIISLREPIAEELAEHFVTREHVFTLMNSWYPGERYLRKYGLEVGKELPITLDVIQRGTCTPLILKFSTVDREDYFESEGKS